MGWPGPMTERQFRTWNAWLDQQWNKPTLTDHYLMEVGAEVRRGWVKDPHKVKIEDMRLTFHDSNQQAKPRKATPQQRILAAQLAKARWQGMMGTPIATTPPTLQPPTTPISPPHE